MKVYLFAAISCAFFGLSACNGTSQALQSDWVDHNVTAPTATPTPGPSATSVPSADATQLYTGPADVAKYVQKFIDDAKAQGVDVVPNMSNPKLEIQLASLSSYGSSVIGLCETGSGQRRVTFSPTFWNSVSETQRELLAHHELGHCVLYRSHRSDLLPSGAYASIMYPIIMASSTYTSNYAYYQQELFTSNAEMAPSADPNAVTTHVCNLEDLGLSAGGAK